MIARLKRETFMGSSSSKSIKTHAKALAQHMRDSLLPGDTPFDEHYLEEAASFLAEFVEKDTPWVHMDLSAAENEKGLGHVGSKFTGFGVRYTLSIVLEENLFRAND